MTVDPFEMFNTEISQGRFLEVMGHNPSEFSPDDSGPTCDLSCPVEMIDWYEAKAYCETIGGRLPSEAEWEYAALAGATTRFSCGDDEACLDAVAWNYANSMTTTHPVGTKTANAFGLYDMHGNVWEWVEDCPHNDYTGAPTSGGVWEGGNCRFRVQRGGSYTTSGWAHCSYRRVWYVLDSRFSSTGARCAR